ncbi:hypothetical protein Moror_9159 [Moniliophthora roreri MCA 2997]|uniref:Uncharacterized protein n=1 Tax=Moniliophthora roreri (strain MCA 2997) TaxID=1381753 RepID=V2WH05_MONRO|nr:hypothetical protein Moror_9159 [Moniliophthora roreri MCA 2997]
MNRAPLPRCSRGAWGSLDGASSSGSTFLNVTSSRKIDDDFEDRKNYTSHYKETPQQAAARAKLAKQVKVAFKDALLTVVPSADDRHPET